MARKGSAIAGLNPLMEGEEREGGILTRAGPEVKECIWAQDGWEAVTDCSPDVERALLPAALSC